MGAPVRDGEHDAVFRAVERDWVMRGARLVDEIAARAVFSRLIAIAALQDEHFFQPAVAMRGIAAPRLHAYEDGRATSLTVASQIVKVNPFVPGRVPLD